MSESNEFSLAGEPGRAEREGERATCGCPSSPGQLCTASCEGTLQEMWKVSSRYKNQLNEKNQNRLRALHRFWSSFNFCSQLLYCMAGIEV